MTDPADLGVGAAAAAIRDGSLTATELVASCLARIEATDDDIGAWVALDRAGAEAGAGDRDLARGRGEIAGPLHGIPLGVKDIIDVAGLATRAGAPPFAHRLPTADAPLVARLRRAGAVIVGKTHTTQFAYLDPAPTTNPWSADHTPGGSSSGSAAAVAARHVPAAIGTQTGGSILRPAAYCGVVGLKGPHGAVPLDGVIPLAPSMDHGGPFARSVADVALLWSVMADRPAPDLASDRTPRVAFDPGLVARADDELRERLESTIAALRDAGAELTEVHIDSRIDAVVEASVTVIRAEAARVHERWFATHEAEYAPAIADCIRSGRTIDATKLAAAERTRAVFRADVRAWFDDVDAFLSPVATGSAPRRGQGTGSFALCVPWSFIGVPSISLPIGLDRAGLPLALQLTGGTGQDALDRMLRAAAWVEARLDFDARPVLSDRSVGPKPTTVG